MSPREPAISERPQCLDTETIRSQVSCSGLYITASLDPITWEIAPTIGKAGCCERSFLEALWRLLTIARRQLNPIPRKLIISAIWGIRCSLDRNKTSCIQAIADYLIMRWGFEDHPDETWTWTGATTFPMFKSACGERQLTGLASCRQAILQALIRLLYACRRGPNPIPQQLIIKCLEEIACEYSNEYSASCPAAICNLLKTDWNILEWGITDD